MRIDRVYIEDYKNLKKFLINFDEKEMKTVLLGQNATGKSNFLEALILIFKFLDLSTDTKRQTPEFDYNIVYYIKGNKIEVTVKKNVYSILVNDEKIKSFKSFFSQERKKTYQPKYVFTYYSGLSNKLKEHFWYHQKLFYDKITSKNFKDDELDSLRKLFYVQLVHSYFVLLAYFTHEEEDSVKFLGEVLNIQDIESILFILKMPDWAKNRIKADPDDIFWTATGLVRPFLDKLWDLSLAPIYYHEKIQVDFDDYEQQDQLYLFLKGKEKLKELANTYTDNTALFKALESTYISKLISEVRIKVKKKDVDGSITFKELSEGEQQLLTVLGLLKFTKDEDSLILLDEPDTHLNPLWKWRYLEFLEDVVKRPESTQIIINTHDPLVIGSLKKEQIRIFKQVPNEVVTTEPEKDPKGMGVAGILISDLFGLPTILDKETQSKLNKKRYLQGKLMRNEITEVEYKEYQNLRAELEEVGFYEEVEDKWFKMYLSEMSKYDFIQKAEYTEEEKKVLEEASKKAAEMIVQEMNKKN